MSEVLIICLQNNKTKDDKPHNAFTVTYRHWILETLTDRNKAAQNSVFASMVFQS